MRVSAIKTDRIEASTCTLNEVLKNSLTSIPENSVISITSKIVSLCEGNVFLVDSYSKDELIEKEADLFLPKNDGDYDIYLTIKQNLLVPSAGIDESNTGGHYVLWPKNPQLSANNCWEFIKEYFKVKNVGVIITDSTLTPLRWGSTGKCIAYCGFYGLINKINEEDLFGRKLKMTTVNVADSLAASAVLCMGESNEQTPLAILEDIPFVKFKNSPPSIEELDSLSISMKDDLFQKLLLSVSWQCNH